MWAENNNVVCSFNTVVRGWGGLPGEQGVLSGAVMELVVQSLHPLLVLGIGEGVAEGELHRGVLMLEPVAERDHEVRLAHVLKRHNDVVTDDYQI